MVSSIVPGGPSANALGVDHRYVRSQQAPLQVREEATGGDKVEVSSASMAASRESVRAAVTQLHQALAIGHEAQELLVKVQSFARSGGVDAQAALTAALDAFAKRVEAAGAQGAKLIVGEDVAVHAEPGAPALVAPGVDLRLKAAPGEGDILQVSREARVDDRGLAQAAQRSLENLQGAVSQLLEATQAFEAHQGFLGAAESALASSVRHDLDTESARLLALQVRQGLENTRMPIANAEPQAVLSLFRA